jgi:hypothetical protein
VLNSLLLWAVVERTAFNANNLGESEKEMWKTA